MVIQTRMSCRETPFKPSICGLPVRRFSGLSPALMLLTVVLACSPAGMAQLRTKQSAVAAPAKDSAEFYVGQGLADMKNNRYQQAAKEFRSALAIDPNLAVRARFPLAVALFGLFDIKGARREFERVRSKTGNAPDVAYYLGRIDLMEGNLDGAIHNLTVAASKPPFPDTPYYLGYAYIKKHDTGNAEKWLRKAAELAPRDFRVQERLGLLYSKTGRKEEAAKAFALSKKLRAQDASATGIALECEHALDTLPLQEAHRVCQKLFDPENTSKLVTLGMLYGHHKDYSDALQPFRRAAQLEPDSYEIQYNLGLTYFRLKRYAEARGPLEKAVALRPDMFETTAPLGAVEYALGDDSAAYKTLGRAHELRPENADISGLLFEVTINLAEQSLENKDPATALKYFLEATGIRPNDPGVHSQLARVYSLLGEKVKASTEREQAQRLAQAAQ